MAFKQVDTRIQILIALLGMTSMVFVNNSFDVVISLGFLGLLVLGTPQHTLKTIAHICLVPYLFLLILMLFNSWFVQSGTPLMSFGAFTITDQGLWTGFMFAYRLAWLFAMGVYLSLLVDPIRMCMALSALLKPLKHLKVPVVEVSFVISLALRFLPTIKQEALDIYHAQLSRGAYLTSYSWKSKVQLLIATVIPLFASTLRQSDHLALALEARAFDTTQPRSMLHPFSFRTREWLWLIFALCYGVLLVLL